jgi:membrane-associated phospholipid phosphatase
MVQSRLRQWQLALGICSVVILLCIFYVDRPVADFVNTHVRSTSLWAYLSDLLAPPVAFVAGAGLLTLLASGCVLLSGRALPDWSATPILCSWSIVWALAAQAIFKDIFGRASTTTYVQNHLYEFRYFHASSDWNSFPSGTATVATAITAVLWGSIPGTRIYGVLSVATIAVLLVLTNGHWVSDVIAGILLGAYIGNVSLLLRANKG